MGANCGLYVPSYSERLDMGVEHKLVHPNFSRHDDLMEDKIQFKTLDSGAVVPDHIGTKIVLPDSTPKSHWFNGETFTFADPTRDTIHKIGQKAPGLHFVTYPYHGRRAGSFRQWQRGAWGIDIPLSRFHEKCNAAEEEAGDRLTYWIVREWDWLGLNYLIWWNWMIESPETGWFDYEPYADDYTQGDQNYVTSRHFDHGHVQRDNPHVAGNN